MITQEEKSKREALFTDVVKHLALSLRNVRAYPPGHPYVERTLRKAFELVNQAMGGRDELAVCVFENNVMVEDIRIGSRRLPAVVGFLKLLRKIDVRSINFYRGFRLEDVSALFSVLSEDRSVLKDKGGVVHLLSEKNVEGIRLNEVEFGIISKGGRPKEIKEVTLTWQTFESLLSTPKMLLDRISEAPGDVAELLTQFGEEGLSKEEKAVENVAQVAASLSEAYGEGERAQYAEKLTQFVETVTPAVRGKIDDKAEFDEKIAKVIRKSLEGLSDGELVSTVMVHFRGVMEQAPGELRGQMRGFLGGMCLNEERKSFIYPVLKERLMDEGVAEDDILAILEEEDERTFEHMLDDPHWLMKEAVRDPTSVADLMVKSGVEGVGETGRVATNLQRVFTSLSGLYGEDERAEYAKRVAQFVSTTGPALRDRLAEKKEFDDKLAKIIRKALEDLSDEELVMTITSTVSESADLTKPEVRRGLRSLVGEVAQRETALPNLRAALSRIGVAEEGVLSLMGEEILGDILPKGKRTPTGEAVLLQKGTLEHLKERIRESVEVKDVADLLGPLAKTLEDKSVEVRKRGVESLGEMLEGLLERGQSSMAESLTELLRVRLDEEESFEVYLACVGILERIARKMRSEGREDIAEQIRATFTQQISEEGKRKRAVEALGKVGGTDALISLLSALWESGIYKEVRDAIVRMGKEGMPLVIEIFREAEDKLLRRRIIDLLVNVGEAAVQPVAETVDDERWYVRRDAARVLSEISGASTLSPLVTFLSDKELTVRKEAAAGIGKIGGEEAEAHLLNALESGDRRLRPDLLRILGNTGGENSVSRLSALLEEPSVSDKEKIDILRALGQIGNEAASEHLKQVIQEKAFMGRPKFSDEVRASAIYALAKIGGPNVRAMLEEVSREKSKVIQLAAAAALRRLKKIPPASK